MNKIKLCSRCNEREVLRDKNGKTKGKCHPCLKEYNRVEIAGKRRQYKLELLAANDESTGWRVCTVCLTHKRFSEFSTNRKDGHGRINKLCDACLTSIYLTDARRSEGFDEIWWRKRAYTCNTAYRKFISRQKAIPVSSIKTADLDYACKPQDITKIFDKQKGCCHYCEAPLKCDNTSIDHATPLSRGGAHHPLNFRVACMDCNAIKFTRTEEEFIEFLKDYITRFKFSSRTSG